jgi:hypothetical protein
VRAYADPRLGRASGASSTARSRMRRTAIRSSDRRPERATSSTAAPSPSASRRRAAPAGSSPSWVVNGAAGLGCLAARLHAATLPFADKHLRARPKALETYPQRVRLSPIPRRSARRAGRRKTSAAATSACARLGAVFGARVLAGSAPCTTQFPAILPGLRVLVPAPALASRRRARVCRGGNAGVAVHGSARLGHVRGRSDAGAAGWLDQHDRRGPARARVGPRSAYFCAPRGGIVSEMTVSQLPDGRFRLIGAAAAAERHDEHWLLEPPARQRHGPLSIVKRHRSATARSSYSQVRARASCSGA